jgi:hypothetical protein
VKTTSMAGHFARRHCRQERRKVAAKFGPEIGLRDLLDRFSYDCLRRAEARSKKGKSTCGVYLPDLEQPPPLGLVRLHVVASND